MSLCGVGEYQYSHLIRFAGVSENDILDAIESGDLVAGEKARYVTGESFEQYLAKRPECRKTYIRNSMVEMDLRIREIDEKPITPMRSKMREFYLRRRNELKGELANG